MGKKWMKMAMVGLGILLASCSALKDVPKQPEVAVSAVKVKNINSRGGLVNVTLNVKNPNSFGIPTERIGYTLLINGLKVANGARTEKLRIPANGTKAITLPIAFTFSNVLQVFENVVQKKKLNFSLKGNVKLPFVSVPFSKTGKLF